jgi:gluconolactonase
MSVTRRAFLTTASVAAALAAAPRAFAQWQPSQRYPDPAVQVVDQSFARYRLNLAKVERLATGFRWSEGPAWFGDGRYLLWSDIPNNRIMRWDEETGVTSVFRKPSNFSNGNTRDRQGRLLTCEHGMRTGVADGVRRHRHDRGRPPRG